MTAAGPTIRNGSVLLRDGKIAAVGTTVSAPTDADVIDGRGKYRHARDHRHALAPRRLCGARRRRAVGRQRGDESGDGAGVGRALGVAAGPAVPAGARGRRDDGADPPRLSEPDRRPQRRTQVVPSRDCAGDEVPGREVRTEDGVRREPEARVRATRPVHAHGQRRRLSRGVDPGGGLSAPLGQMERRPPGRRAAARPRDRDARRSAARQHSRAQPLLPRRRDGADDRHREGVRLQDPLVPPRRGGVQDRGPASRKKASRRRCGPTGAGSRWKRWTAFARTSRWWRPRARARSCIRTTHRACSD